MKTLQFLSEVKPKTIATFFSLTAIVGFSIAALYGINRGERQSIQYKPRMEYIDLNYDSLKDVFIQDSCNIYIFMQYPQHCFEQAIVEEVDGEKLFITQHYLFDMKGHVVARPRMQQLPQYKDLKQFNVRF